ncbi:lasso peptide biosynthesis PqqD family chaperone [Frankia sp. R82]|uniref:lasso peptide biosynthesis PqqD family chaperone n=1 Tax=Frankia sp. R82 TaxID=2950553 RepID=UPI0020438745|nr:lasso peptide biosynthesis PqqD family chaperone [Frankia sp. R82]MCM3883616.1 lasso peptide biosynthesis PqqD family chaperone [Frankia sp. R82]
MVTLRSDVVRAPTEYGAVLLHTHNGRYWTLNPSGDLVLGVLLAGGDVAAATGELCTVSDVDPDTARRDVEGLLAQLTDVGLIDPTGEAGGEASGQASGGAFGHPRADSPPSTRSATDPAGRSPRHRPGRTSRPDADRSRTGTGPGAGLRSRLRRRR